MPALQPQPAVLLPTAVAALSLLAGTACADVFILKGGGRVEGQWLNKDQSPQTTFQVRTASGGEVVIDRSDVEQIHYQTEAHREYQRLRPRTPDTPHGHHKVAEWCLENKLFAERRSHLRRIIELDPDDPEARRALGYRLVKGQWMTREEEMAARGMTMYEGRYRTAQEIDLLENNRKLKLASLEWDRRMERWYKDLQNPRKAEEALEEISQIRDPLAVGAMAEYLEGEYPRPWKVLLLDVLAQIDSSAAVQMLVERSLKDRDKEVRLTALDHLIDDPPAAAVSAYVAALKSKDNGVVNRAAASLRSLQATEVIAALIESLVTEHEFKIVTGPPGQMSTSFDRSGRGGGGLSFGGGGPRIIKRNLANREVLSALVDLTGGVNFQYDIEAWKQWHARQKKTDQPSFRRD